MGASPPQPPSCGGNLPPLPHGSRVLVFTVQPCLWCWGPEEQNVIYGRAWYLHRYFRRGWPELRSVALVSGEVRYRSPFTRDRDGLRLETVAMVSRSSVKGRQPLRPHRNAKLSRLNCRPHGIPDQGGKVRVRVSKTCFATVMSPFAGPFKRC